MLSQTMNQVTSHMKETEYERESAPLAVDAENEQPDTSHLPAAANTLSDSLQTTIHQNPTLMQPSLRTPPTLHLQSDETPPLGSTSPIANHQSMYNDGIILKINGSLKEMAAGWTEEEWINNRRIVQFEKSQDGEILNVDFKAVPVNEIPANSICISCIWWDTLSDCYLTRFDAMYLLEQLMGAPGRFSVERKNRLRRNLEGFHPVTISKTNPHNSGLFKTVMAFGYPRPRDIEGDFRVLPWNCLEPMLRKMIGKYKFMPFGIYNDIIRRERGPHADDTPVAFSKLPGILVDRPGISLPWLEDTVFNIVKDVDVDEDVRERLLGVVPDFLGAVALKIGDDILALSHRDTTYFVDKYRQQAESPQE